MSGESIKRTPLAGMFFWNQAIRGVMLDAGVDRENRLGTPGVIEV